MITCDHTALHIFPSKQIDHLINLAIQLSPVDMPSATLVSITFRQVEYVSYILVWLRSLNSQLKNKKLFIKNLPD